MSKITKLSNSVKTAIEQANAEVNNLTQQINKLTNEKHRYMKAPIARKAVSEMLNENITRISEDFEAKDVTRYLHDCALYETRSESNRAVTYPSLNNFLVSGITGDPYSWKIKPEALIWLLRDVMQERLNENINSIDWPLEFKDGCSEEERQAKITKIDDQLENLITQKKAILNEIEAAGGRLTTTLC